MNPSISMDHITAGGTADIAEDTGKDMVSAALVVEDTAVDIVALAAVGTVAWVVVDTAGIAVDTAALAVALQLWRTAEPAPAALSVSVAGPPGKRNRSGYHTLHPVPGWGQRHSSSVLIAGAFCESPPSPSQSQLASPSQPFLSPSPPSSSL